MATPVAMTASAATARNEVMTSLFMNPPWVVALVSGRECPESALRNCKWPFTKRLHPPDGGARATRRATRARGRPARAASGRRRRRSPRARAETTTPPSARAESAAAHRDCPWRSGPYLGLPPLDELDDPGRRLLDRQVRHLDHRAAELPVDVRRVVQLLVDLDQRRVLAVAAAEPPRALLTDLGEALRADREADHFRLVDLEQRRRRVDSLHDRDVRRLVAQVAQVHRQRRLRRAGDADEDDVGVVQPGADAVVVLDGELDRRHPPEVLRVERRPRARRHARRLPRHAGDCVDRMPEQVAVVEAGTLAEVAHRFAHLLVDERVDDHRRPALRARDREPQVVDGVDPRMDDLLEALL